MPLDVRTNCPYILHVTMDAVTWVSVCRYVAACVSAATCWLVIYTGEYSYSSEDARSWLSNLQLHQALLHNLILKVA